MDKFKDIKMKSKWVFSVLTLILTLFIVSCKNDINNHSNIYQTEYQVDNDSAGNIQNNSVGDQDNSVGDNVKGINNLTDNEIINKIINRLNNNDGIIVKLNERYHDYKYHLSSDIIIRTFHKGAKTTVIINDIEINAEQSRKLILHMLIIKKYKEIQFEKIENL